MTNDPKALFNTATGKNETSGPVVHVRVQGRSRDIAIDLLGLTPASPDELVREAVARFMEVPLDQLRYSVIERHANGNMTVRPEAVFG